MSDYALTQLQLFLTAIQAYRGGRWTLEAFLESLESPLLFIRPFALRGQLDDLLFEIEAIRAISSELHRSIAAKEQGEIASVLDRLEAVVQGELNTRRLDVE